MPFYDAKRLYVAVLCALLSGCFNTASYTRNSSPFTGTTDKTEVLAVLPFTGNAALSRGAGEWFAHKLQMDPRYQVISPGSVEVRLASISASPPEASAPSLESAVAANNVVAYGAPDFARPIDVEEAKRLGALLNAQLVVLGRVMNRYGLIGQIDVALIDVSRGELLRHTSSLTIMEMLKGPYPAAVNAVEDSAQWLLTEMQAGDVRGRPAATDVTRPRQDRLQRCATVMECQSPTLAGTR